MLKIIRFAPLCILFILSIVSWFTIATTEATAQWMHYVGTGLLLITIVASFIHPRIGKVLTGVTLLLTTFKLAAFTSTITTISYWFGPITFPKYQPLGLGLLVLFVILHFKAILRFLNIRTPDAIAAEQAKAENDNIVQS
ncbi:hypothetical protein WJU16_23490 [Chitinophaga pollutisoli]|uniref:Uncharacterized protein n=1 Tax=Chitinophaga pollutisoli TaxID=3133966 RepID=A0ABZ2YPW2_9BACT